MRTASFPQAATLAAGRIETAPRLNTMPNKSFAAHP